MTLRIILIAVIFAAGVGASYQLHLMGEPQSRWLWCRILADC